IVEETIRLPHVIDKNVLPPVIVVVKGDHCPNPRWTRESLRGDVHKPPVSILTHDAVRPFPIPPDKVHQPIAVKVAQRHAADMFQWILKAELLRHLPKAHTTLITKETISVL